MLDEVCISHVSLNAMCKLLSNVAFNNILFSCKNITFMQQHIHETVVRLVEALTQSRAPFDGPSDLARELNVSPQQINSWSKRGLSKEAIVQMGETYGIRSAFLRNGEFPMFYRDAPLSLRAASPLLGYSKAHAVETTIGDSDEFASLFSGLRDSDKNLVLDLLRRLQSDAQRSAGEQTS